MTTKRLVRWACPTCGTRGPDSPPSARLSHHCPKNRNHETVFVIVPDEED